MERMEGHTEGNKSNRETGKDGQGNNRENIQGRMKIRGNRRKIGLKGN